MPPAPKAELGPEAECPGHLLICDLYKFPCCPVPQFPQKRVGRGLGRGLAAQGMPALQACSFRGTPSGDPAGTRQSPSADRAQRCQRQTPDGASALLRVSRSGRGRPPTRNSVSLSPARRPLPWVHASDRCAVPSARSCDTARSFIRFPRTEPPGEARGVRLGAELREEKAAAPGPAGSRPSVSALLRAAQTIVGVGVAGDTRFHLLKKGSDTWPPVGPTTAKRTSALTKAVCALASRRSRH